MMKSDKREIELVAAVNGGAENMVNWDGKDKDTLVPDQIYGGLRQAQPGS